MSDVFERLKCGSASHKVKVSSGDGSFTLEPLADKDSSKAFQPKARGSNTSGSEGQFTHHKNTYERRRFRKPVRSNHHFPRLAVAAGAFCCAVRVSGIGGLLDQSGNCQCRHVSHVSIVKMTLPRTVSMAAILCKYRSRFSTGNVRAMPITVV